MELLLLALGIFVTVMVLPFRLLRSASALWQSRQHVAARWLVRLIAWLRLEPIVYRVLLLRRRQQQRNARAYRRLSRSIWRSVDPSVYLGRFLSQCPGAEMVSVNPILLGKKPESLLPTSAAEGKPSVSSSDPRLDPRGDVLKYSRYGTLPQQEGQSYPMYGDLSKEGIYRGWDVVGYPLPKPPYLPSSPPPQSPSQGSQGVPKRQKGWRRATGADMRRLGQTLRDLSQRPRKPSTASSKASVPKPTRKSNRKPARAVRRRKSG